VFAISYFTTDPGPPPELPTDASEGSRLAKCENIPFPSQNSANCTIIGAIANLSATLTTTSPGRDRRQTVSPYEQIFALVAIIRIPAYV
jgi:hypothetical protein